jgi:large subunit ribosomal protein L4
MSTNLKVLDAAGNEVEDFELKPEWLVRDKGDQAVHDEVVAYLAGRRAGTAATKTRSNVRGGGAKPWRQKGTGRARAGSIRSPLWRGGGIIFGPQPRDFSKKTNKKVRRLALRRAFTSRIDEDAVTILDKIDLDAPKTRKLVEALWAIDVGEIALIIADGSENENLFLSARNLPHILVVSAASVNVYQMLAYDKIVLLKGAIESFSRRLT